MSAIAIEAQRATTAGRGAKHESAVPERQSPKPGPVDQGEVMMSERKYISGTMKDPSGKVIAERTFTKPHTNIWAAMTELAKGKREPSS